MTKILWGVLFLIGTMGFAAGPAMAGLNGVAPVPAPEMGEGLLGMLLAAGAVHLIKRRAR